jgi:hypothetical protein
MIESCVGKLILIRIAAGVAAVITNLYLRRVYLSTLVGADMYTLPLHTSTLHWTQVAATPADAATGLRAAAGPSALDAMGQGPGAGEGGGGGRPPRGMRRVLGALLQEAMQAEEGGHAGEGSSDGHAPGSQSGDDEDDEMVRRVRREDGE